MSHNLSNLFSHEEEKVYHVLRLPSKSFSQLRVLGCYSDGASIQVTFTHHDTARCHQRRGRKPKFIGTEQRPNNHITTRTQSAVNLN